MMNRNNGKKISNSTKKHRKTSRIIGAIQIGLVISSIFFAIIYFTNQRLNILNKIQLVNFNKYVEEYGGKIKTNKAGNKYYYLKINKRVRIKIISFVKYKDFFGTRKSDSRGISYEMKIKQRDPFQYFQLFKQGDGPSSSHVNSYQVVNSDMESKFIIYTKKNSDDLNPKTLHWFKSNIETWERFIFAYDHFSFLSYSPRLKKLRMVVPVLSIYNSSFNFKKILKKPMILRKIDTANRAFIKLGQLYIQE